MSALWRARGERSLEGADLGLRGLALAPVLEFDDGEAEVFALTGGEAASGDEQHMLDAGKALGDLVDVEQGLLGPSERGPGGQHHVAQERALVLGGEERPRQPVVEEVVEREYRAEDYDGQHSAAHQKFCEREVAVARPVDRVVEPAVRTARSGPFAQHYRAERGRERHRVDGGEAERDAHRDRELGVDLADHAAVEGDRRVHRDDHQRGRDQRAGDLAHGFERGVARRESVFLNHAHTAFGHAYRVVHDRADDEDQREHRQRVDAHAEGLEEDERADERHRYRHRRDDRGAPVLQKGPGYHDHEQEGQEQRGHDLLHRHADEVGGVVAEGALHALGEVLRQFFQLGVHAVEHVERVGVVEFEDGERDRRLAVEVGGPGVAVAAEFHPGHVAQPDEPVVVSGLDDDVFKLGGFAEPPLGVDLELHAVAGKLRADRAGRRLHVLVGHRGADVRSSDAEGAHLVGVHPDAHAVGHVGEDHRVADSVDARYRVAHVDGHIVAQEQRSMLRIVAGDRVDAEDVVGALVDEEPVVDHLGGQRVLGALDRVVHVDVGHIGVRVRLEGHGERVVAGVVRGRGVVEHVLDSVDLGFDRRGHGVGDDLRARAGIGRHHHHRGRRDLRILRDGELEDAHQTRDDQEQRDHQCELGSPDEECGKHSTFTPLAKCAGSLPVRFGETGGVHGPAGGGLVDAAGDDRLARLESGEDDLPVPDLFADRDVAPFDLVVLVHDVDIVAPAVGHQRGNAHRRARFGEFLMASDRHEPGRDEFLIRVGDEELKHQRAGPGIDHVVHEVQRRLALDGSTVGADYLQFWHALSRGPEVAQIVRFAHREADLDGIVLHDGGQRSLRRSDVVVAAVDAPADASVDGRVYFCVGEVVFSEGERGLGRLKPRFAAFEGPQGALVVGPAGGLVGDQLFVAVELAFGECEFGFHLRDRRLGGTDVRGVNGILDVVEQFALFDQSALLERRFLHRAGDAGDHLDQRIRRTGRDITLGFAAFHGRDLFDPHRRRRAAHLRRAEIPDRRQ